MIINFNGMSTCPGLFYAQKLENRIHYTFIFTLFVWLFLKRFLHTIIWFKVFLSNTNNSYTINWFQVTISIQ